MITCRFENGSSASLRHVVADAIVTRGDEILLVKRTHTLLEGGKWGIVGGYVERDETIEEAVIREVMEETGYSVKDVVLFRIIDTPQRPGEDRQNVAFVHFCIAVEKLQDGDHESDEQRWFPLSALPERSQIAFDHLNSIEMYIGHLQKKFQIPLVG